MRLHSHAAPVRPAFRSRPTGPPVILAAQGIRAEWEPCCGHLPALVIAGSPVLHAAPWRDEPEIQADAALPVVDRRLGGTFVCAPFGRDDVDGGPPHGLTANARWTTVRATASALTASRVIPRGRVTARIALRDGHPALYQTHTLDLAAPCTFAHHPMIRARGGATMTTSATSARTFPPMEAPGVERLPADTVLDPADLHDLPTGTGADFVTMIHPPGLGWTAIARRAEADTILFLKRAEQLPLTHLWLSDGGRTQSPWNGRHTGVIGVEDAICAGACGFRAALDGTSRLTGLPLALPPGRHTIPHAILRLPGCHAVRAVRLCATGLRIDTRTGPLSIPFDDGHLR